MLVLSRKESERIQIGDDVVVTITSIKGNRVSLGIEAPKEVSVRRWELPTNRAVNAETGPIDHLECRQPKVA